MIRAVARRKQELLAHPRRKKRRLEAKVGSVHDDSEAKHILTEPGRALDAADAEEYAAAVGFG
jgi:hypothetical protein